MLHHHYKNNNKEEWTSRSAHDAGIVDEKHERATRGGHGGRSLISTAGDLWEEMGEDALAFFWGENLKMCFWFAWSVKEKVGKEMHFDIFMNKGDKEIITQKWSEYYLELRYSLNCLSNLVDKILSDNAADSKA